MPTYTITEKFDSRKIVRGTGGYAELTFEVETDDTSGDWPVGCMNYALAEVDSTYDGQALARAEITERRLKSVIIVVRYGIVRSGSISSDGKAASWSTGGNKERVTEAISVVNSYIPSGETTTPDFGTSINVTENGVEGVDVVRPALEFALTRRMLADDYSDAYLATIAGLTGTVNQAAFLGFAAGEVLFMGADANQPGTGEPYQITYKFQARRNATNITVGPITGIAKKGHEYIWALYEKDESNGFVVDRARAVYVAKVYPDGNFSGIVLA